MAHLLARLAGAAAHHWKRSLALVAVVLAALAVLAGAGGSFSDDFSSPGTESQQALDLLKDRFPSQSGDTATVVFSVDRGTLRDGARPAAIARTVAAIRSQPHVTSAVDPLSARAKGQLSRDGRIAFATVQYDRTASDLGTAPGKRLEGVGVPAERDGIDVARRGQIVDQAEQQTAPVGELIGVAVAVIVLTVVFGSASAMLLTLLSAGLALAGGLMLLSFGTRFADFPSFAPTLGVMLGLGAGIDYALLIVGRYREQLAAGDSVRHSAAVANATAGTSVVAAGAIVVVAISGLLATGIPFVGRMGVGSAIVVGSVALGRGDGAARAHGRVRPATAAEGPRAGRAVAPLRRVGPAPGRAAVAGGRPRRARAGVAGHAVHRPAPGPARRRQRPAFDDDAQGLRQARRGLRARLQRPARARREGAGRAGGPRRRRARAARASPAPRTSRRPRPRASTAPATRRRSR